MNQTNYLTDEQMAHFKGYYIIVFLIFIDLLGHYFLYNFLIEEMNQKDIPEVTWGKVMGYQDETFLNFQIEQDKNSEKPDTLVIQKGHSFCGSFGVTEVEALAFAKKFNCLVKYNEWGELIVIIQPRD